METRAVVNWRRNTVVAQGWSSLVLEDAEPGLDCANTAVLKVKRTSIPGFTSPADRAGLEDAWTREGQALDALQGTEGIVRLLGVAEVEGSPAYRLIRVNGVPLTDAPRVRPWSLAQVRRIMTSVAGAVGRMHSAGWLHLDLNPSNVLLGPDLKSVTLLDLGAAAPIGTQATWSWPLGRHVFMAPEQLAVCAEVPGPMRGPRADAYQLAFLTAFLLTGEHPFRSCGDEEDYRIDYLPSVFKWSQMPGSVKASFVARARPDLPGWMVELLTICADPCPDLRLGVAAFEHAMVKGELP